MAIFTAIGAAIFGAGTFLAGLTAAGLEVAAGIALNYIAKALSGDSSSSSATGGIQGTIQAGGDIPRSILMGYYATAGSLVYANTWGNSGDTPNAYLTQVICLADYPIQSLEQVWVDGELCTLGDTPHASYGYPVTQYAKDGVDHLWVKFYDGTQTAADTFLTGTVASTARPYGSTRVGTGCPYVIATALIEESLFSGFPKFKFAVIGAKLYDITKDTTAGGSGSQRWSDPSTWGGDGDYFPAVQTYNILRGITYGGDWLYGLQGLTAAGLPSTEWLAAIGACRTTITGPAGSEATYRAGAEVSVGTAIATTIEGFLTSCQGRLAEIGGTYKLRVGVPGSSIFSFSDGSIISTEAQSFTPFFGLDDTVNGISATYPSPADGWNNKVAPPLLRPDLETLDGSRRLMADVSLDFVPYDGQVQRLMKSALDEARRARRHTFVLPPEAFVLEPGDIIDWTSVRNGYSAKLFRVDGVSDRSNLDVMIDITEVDPADYDWDQATDFTSVDPGSVIRVRPSPQLMTGWTASGSTMIDPDGNGWLPSVLVGWASGLADVRAVRIQVRESWDSKRIIFDGEIAYDSAVLSPDAIINALFLANKDYEVRGIYLPFSGRVTRWSNQDGDGVDGDWLTITTPNVSPLPAESIRLATLARDVTNWVGGVAGTVRQLVEQFKEMGTLLEGADRENYTQRQTLSRSIDARLGDIEASFNEIIEVAVSPTGAIGLALQSLYAAMGGNTSEVNVRWQAAAAPAGYSARYAIQAAVNDGTFRAATLFLDVPADNTQPTRIGLEAGQTVFFTSDGTPLALIGEDGVFRSANGVVQLNMLTGAMSITVA